MFTSQLKKTKKKKKAGVLPERTVGLDSQEQFHLEVALAELDLNGNNARTDGESV